MTSSGSSSGGHKLKLYRRSSWDIHTTGESLTPTSGSRPGLNSFRTPTSLYKNARSSSQDLMVKVKVNPKSLQKCDSKFWTSSARLWYILAEKQDHTDSTSNRNWLRLQTTSHWSLGLTNSRHRGTKSRLQNIKIYAQFRLHFKNKAKMDC
ncbi:hypothetical protein AC579_8866 [Pseudocercospora musae]|uniref:Uncharacterized protein n=1 Tax=Pseudocercospora musae TaxID=113226 RepID=A0A139IGZ7_9PEZI|nr:hypothetical protein AC579_8866 [Pseudocercospora musae]